jgi:hypothetical protein
VVTKKVPHRYFIFTIPKILRRYFLYGRKLLSELRRCVWESLKVFLKEVIPEKDPIAGAGLFPLTHKALSPYTPPHLKASSYQPTRVPQKAGYWR